ncbi:MAG: nucleoside kinase [Oscillospiraceae bacterium]
MKYITISSINSGIKNNAGKFVEESENIYNNQLLKAAEKIKASFPEKSLVLISGPSGSGKTTSALRVSNILNEMGYSTYSISMDNYFRSNDSENMPLDENGEIDLESPLCLDIDLFSEHMYKLQKCEPIEIPVFDFAKQSRSEQTIPFCRSKNQIVVIEGIHALNPLVTGEIDAFTTKIYVSVRTRIVAENEYALHPQEIRLMRRLCRDTLFRGRKPQDVFKFFKSVSRGEELYIMPYKHRADIDIDTFIAYEPSAYKEIILPELLKIKTEMNSNKHYREIVNILCKIEAVDKNEICPTSLIREFVGGSSLNYI